MKMTGMLVLHFRVKICRLVPLKGGGGGAKSNITLVYQTLYPTHNDISKRTVTLNDPISSNTVAKTFLAYNNKCLTPSPFSRGFECNRRNVRLFIDQGFANFTMFLLDNLDDE